MKFNNSTSKFLLNLYTVIMIIVFISMAAYSYNSGDSITILYTLIVVAVGLVIYAHFDNKIFDKELRSDDAKKQRAHDRKVINSKGGIKRNNNVIKDQNRIIGEMEAMNETLKAQEEKAKILLDSAKEIEEEKNKNKKDNE